MNQSKYDTPYSFRLRKSDRVLLAELAKRWNTIKTGVIRRLIAEATVRIIDSQSEREGSDEKPQ